ncbi:Cysteine-rich secretory protein family protein [Cohaesibacter sp. ES.047]|uniref:CAP domain-containing protein n=1 Tax=Cohaesibacter sp. ES.047 TaxID=1798205 RepID=UPI000BB9B506|nr:CAP domain-containing protein [Cohaesibacter sp. ES.047]SNY90848.1 Cysteine-rich secretory protein family protein [Cohaesibacter sp. ES.047]
MLKSLTKTLVLAGLVGALLTACTSGPDLQTPAMYERLNKDNAKVDPQAALELVNAYRKRNGLGTLTLSPRLAAAAQEQSDAMASSGRVDHALSKNQTLIKRLGRAGYDPVLATENIGAGYWSLAEAFSGWRDSRRHNLNMLKKGVTEMGIATSYRENVKYKVFWTLILAKPDEPPISQAVSTDQPRPNTFFAQ